jgi:hypothetical protein
LERFTVPPNKFTHSLCVWIEPANFTNACVLYHLIIMLLKRILALVSIPKAIYLIFSSGFSSFVHRYYWSRVFQWRRALSSAS